MEMRVTLCVDGAERTCTVDTRTTLLDALRDRLGVFSPKKGCDHGQCGSCTVLLDGRRVTTCLSLAVRRTAPTSSRPSGLSDSGLHAVQQAFIDQ
ncbi:2Fe-2S iron-sulfur cluster binding domain-containing protein, partial [Rhodococcus hoagii]|nr:2Fe-2S iron-sulfur cluster binding domain-containing protein [Prescottella equi]